MKDKINAAPKEIKVTSDYHLFSFIEGNRSFSHKKKIIESIKRIGLIPSPIICNEKMQVIDGQGRFQACKELELPIYYIIVPGLGIEQCISMNINQTNWTMIDYIKSYAAQGNQNYERLLRLMDRHPAIRYKVIIAAASNAVQGSDDKTIKNGYLKIDSQRINHADDILNWMDENIIPLKKKIGGRFEFLLFALIFSYEHSGANIKRLEDTVKNYAYEFSPIGTIRDALTQIERFYNKNMKSNKIYFLTEYDKFLTNTNASWVRRWKDEVQN